ncbi:hypothetical protein [Acinetobacter ursingii]|uniref:hypothetical protein n=1 Tax=Acinetobacter ursingii TaxID=108980 RepID=UPI001250BFBC|nr:hypothetical protein [Acinetobacter ursingii]
MNLFEIYEAAIENAVSNDIVLDTQYISDYVDGALNAYIPEALAQKIVDAHNEWLDSEHGSHNYYVILQAPLEEYEIIV